MRCNGWKPQNTITTVLTEMSLLPDVSHGHLAAFVSCAPGCTSIDEVAQSKREVHRPFWQRAQRMGDQ